MNFTVKGDKSVRERRNTALLHDSSRTILASDGQIATVPSSDVVKVEPQPNIRHESILFKIQSPRGLVALIA